MTSCRTLWPAALSLIAFVLVGCASKTSGPSYDVSVEGTVSEFVDATPADGNLEFIVEADDGQRIRFYLPSFLVRTDSTDADWRLYERIAGTQDADEVLAEGDFQDEGAVRLRTFEKR